MTKWEVEKRERMEDGVRVPKLVPGGAVKLYTCDYYILVQLAWSSLVPRPCPVFCRLQYRKAGRAWYLFSCEHDVIKKSENGKILNAQAVFHVLFN